MANRKVYDIALQIGGKVNASLGQAFNNANNQLSQMQKNANRANKSFNAMKTAVAGAGAFFAIDSFKKLTGAMIENGSSLEQYRNTLNIVMKDQVKAAKTMEWAVDFANKTPFETNSVIEATAKLESYGLKAQKILPLTGDMAGVMNKGIIQAVEAIADAQTGELERLKEFGITKVMIEKKAAAMYRNTVVVNKKGQIKDQKKFNNALMAIMQEKFSGGMEKQSKTFKGTMSTIAGVWSSALAQMAGVTKTGEILQGGLFETVAKQAQKASKILQHLSESGAFQKISEHIGNILAGAGKVSSFIVNNWSTIEPIVFAISSALLGYKLALIAVIAQQKAAMVVSTLARAYAFATTVISMMTGGYGVLATAQMVLNAAMLANPIFFIAAGFAVAVAAGIILWKNWDFLKTKAFELWEALQNTIGNIGTFVTNIMKQAWEGYKSYLNFILGGLNKIIGVANTAGKAAGINIPQIPMLAKGTNNFQGGPAIVGEKEAEVVELPRGARVAPASRLKQLKNALPSGNSGGVTINTSITINGNADSSDIHNAVNESFKEFERKLDAALSKKRRLGYA